MAKDFAEWHALKGQLDSRKKLLSFDEGEVWWCSIGINVGTEEDGKNVYFERPIIIIRKFNRKMFWALMITSKVKKSPFYYIFRLKGAIETAILSQLKTLSAKRLQRRIGKIDSETLTNIKKAAGIQ